MSGVLDWSPPWSKSVGELAPIASTSGLPASAPLNSCIAHPPGFPGLELVVPHDTAAGIETLVEHALGDTVVGIKHGVLDLPTPDSLNADTVFGPSYSRLVKTQKASRDGAARSSSSATTLPKLAAPHR